MGATQYVDAYQRANFWGTVSAHTGYHVLLGGPTIQPQVTLTVPKRSGTTGTPFGHTAAEVDINYFDAQIQTIMKNTAAIQPNTLPIFVVYDTYLTQNRSCCIGGYHSSFGLTSAPQSYAVFSYVDHPGDFSQDVSALSHEIGEWMDDPLVVNSGNNTPCGSLENGDPLENNANFGGFPYTLGGFTYNLQDLVTLPYFGAPPSTSVNNEFTFQGESLTVCQNGSNNRLVAFFKARAHARAFLYPRFARRASVAQVAPWEMRTPITSGGQRHNSRQDQSAGARYPAPALHRNYIHLCAGRSARTSCRLRRAFLSAWPQKPSVTPSS